MKENHEVEDNEKVLFSVKCRQIGDIRELNGRQ